MGVNQPCFFVWKHVASKPESSKYWNRITLDKQWKLWICIRARSIGASIDQQLDEIQSEQAHKSCRDFGSLSYETSPWPRKIWGIRQYFNSYPQVGERSWTLIPKGDTYLQAMLQLVHLFWEDGNFLAKMSASSNNLHTFLRVNSPGHRIWG